MSPGAVVTTPTQRSSAVNAISRNMPAVCEPASRSLSPSRTTITRGSRSLESSLVPARARHTPLVTRQTTVGTRRWSRQARRQVSVGVVVVGSGYDELMEAERRAGLIARYKAGVGEVE